MIKKFMSVFFGDKQARDMRRLMPIVEEINLIAKEYESLPDEELQGKASEYRKALRAVPRTVRAGEVAVSLEQAEDLLKKGVVGTAQYGEFDRVTRYPLGLPGQVDWNQIPADGYDVVLRDVRYFADLLPSNS